MLYGACAARKVNGAVLASPVKPGGLSGVEDGEIVFVNECSDGVSAGVASLAPLAGCCALTSPMMSTGGGSWVIKSSSSWRVGFLAGEMYSDSVVTCL